MVEMLKGVSLDGWAQIAQIVSGFATFLALLFAAYEYYLHKPKIRNYHPIHD